MLRQAVKETLYSAMFIILDKMVSIMLLFGHVRMCMRRRRNSVINMQFYEQMCVCVCVCVCERERESERDRQTDTETERRTQRQRET